MKKCILWYKNKINGENKYMTNLSFYFLKKSYSAILYDCITPSMNVLLWLDTDILELKKNIFFCYSVKNRDLDG